MRTASRGLAALSLLAASLACGRAQPLAPVAAVTPTVDMPVPTVASETLVPDEYRLLYEQVAATIDRAGHSLSALPPAEGQAIVMAAELLPASGNRGEALLETSTLEGVRLYLAGLQSLGLSGATLQISDPLLWPDYPRHTEYEAFFAEVAAEAHRRGMTVLVETGPAFADPQYSSVRFDWSRLTVAEYFDGRRYQLERIASAVRPDYLSIGSEQSTEQMLTGVEFDVERYLTFVRQVTAAIGDEVRLGCGSGTWEDSALIERLAGEPGVDFINIHLYPLTNGRVDYLARAAEFAAMARQAGKQAVLGEAWLYKTAPDELAAGEAYQTIYARDVYSFWAPLDARFITLVADLATQQGFAYASFFWSGFFFGYLDYGEETAGLSFSARYAQVNRVIVENLLAGRRSPSGEALRSRLAAEGSGG
jgi:hypothetical protein